LYRLQLYVHAKPSVWPAEREGANPERKNAIGQAAPQEFSRRFLALSPTTSKASLDVFCELTADTP